MVRSESTHTPDHDPIIARIGLPAWNLPSWHPDSLNLLLLLRFQKVEYRIEYEPYGYTSSTGDLPTCEPGDGRILSADETIKRCADELDALHLSDHALPYRTLCTKEILPICEYTLFESDYNFDHFVYGLFKSIPFPYCAYIPRKFRAKVLSRLSILNQTNEAQRLASCQAALQSCEEKLYRDGGPFLLGLKPSSCDAALCAFILFAKHCPVESPSLIDMISTTLLEYCDRVIKAYPIVNIEDSSPVTYQSTIGRIEPQGLEDVQVPNKEADMSPDDLLRQQNNRIAIGIAAAAFFGFILFGNFVRFK